MMEHSNPYSSIAIFGARSLSEQKTVNMETGYES